MIVSLKELGFPIQLRDIKENMFASKVRVAHTTQVKLDELSNEVTMKFMQWSGRNDANHPHWDWHHKCFVMNVAHAGAQFSAMGGLKQTKIANDLMHTSLNGKRKGFQRKVQDFLLEHRKFTAQMRYFHMRTRLVRWKMDILEERLPSRFTTRLDYLTGKVSPTIWISYFRTVWNGWITRKRM
jgi:hypothetical protein